MFTAMPNQISAALQAQLAARLELYTAFNAKALDVVTKVAELNLQMMHQALARATSASRQALASDAPFAQNWATPGQQSPDLNQMLAYGQQLTHIAFDAGTECLRLLQPSLAKTEEQITQQFEGMASHAPAGGNGYLDMLRAAMGQVSSGYDNLIKVSEQAGEAMTNGLDGAVHSIAPKAAKSAKRGAAL